MSANETQVGGSHYKDKAVQPWEAMQAWMSSAEFTGFLRGNAIKYLARCQDKGGIEDLQKARHYLDKLIEVMGAELPESKPTPAQVSDAVMLEIAKAVARRCGLETVADGNLITIAGITVHTQRYENPFDAVFEACQQRGLEFRFVGLVQQEDSVGWQYEIYTQ